MSINEFHSPDIQTPQNGSNISGIDEHQRDTNSLSEAPKIHELANKIFGVEKLHAHQIGATSSILRNQDCLVCTPTGSGKSLCYLLPATIIPGMAVVVSPLISLMRDQLKKCEEFNIPSMLFDSLQDSDERNTAWEDLFSGRIKVLFVSPERLARPTFREKLMQLKINLVAIDEAHCISQW